MHLAFKKASDWQAINKHRNSTILILCEMYLITIRRRSGNYSNGPSIKSVGTKSREIDTLYPLSAKCQHWLNPLPCPCGHTINFEKSEVFCIKKCRRPHLKKPAFSIVRTGQTPPPECGCPLGTASNDLPSGLGQRQ